MVRLNLFELKEMSKQRPAGYLEEILKLGKPDGNGIFVKDSDYEYLINKYANSVAGDPPEVKQDAIKVVPITTTAATAKSENLNNIK